MLKEIMLKYCQGAYSGTSYLTFYYVEGEGKWADKTVVEFKIHHKRLKLMTVKEPEYLDYCKKAAKKWVKENGDVL